MSGARRIRLGTVGWSFPEWIGLFYPAGAKQDELLRRYADRLSIVEAATGYHGMPKTATVEKWAQQTPEGFELSLKAPDWLVRMKPDDPDLTRALGTFMKHLAPLAELGKLGVVVLQYHPSFRREKRAADLAGVLAKLPAGPRWGIELRHESWWHEETYETLRARGATLVWSTLGDSLRTPAVVTSDRVYLRLLGDREMPSPWTAKRRDEAAELAHWAARIREEAKEAARVDVMVSNHLEGYAPATLESLAKLLGVDEPAPARGGTRQTTLM